MKRKLEVEDESDGILSSLPKRAKSHQLESPTSNIDIDEEQLSDDNESTSSSSPSSSEESVSEVSESDEESDDEEDSELSTSTSDDDVSSDEESESESDEIVNMILQKQPSIQPPVPSDLKSRLSSFIPSLAAANASLDRDREHGKLLQRVMDHYEGDEGQYIEMVKSPSFYCLSFTANDRPESGPWHT